MQNIISEIKGFIKIESIYTNLLYRFAFSLLNDLFCKEHNKEILFLVTKSFPILLLKKIVHKEIFEKVKIRSVHDLVDLDLLFKVLTKNKNYQIIFVDSLQHFLLENPQKEVDFILKTMLQLKYKSLQNNFVVVFLNKSERNDFSENNFDVFDYFMLEKIMLKKGEDKYFLEFKKKNKKYLIENEENCDEKIKISLI